MKINHYILFFLFALCALGCQEKIDLSSQKYEKAPVITGKFTNDDGPYTVRISYSSPVNYSEFKPFINCDVTVYEDTGESESYVEVEPGVYQSHENGMHGKIGHSYQLVVETPGGKVYQSDFQKIKEPIGIDTVYAKVEYQERLYERTDLAGYQFYLSTHKASIQENYFLWNMEETYEYTADYPLVSTMENGVRQENIDLDTLYRCWKTDLVREIFAENTIGLTNPKITNHPLHFVGVNSKRLQHRYSLLVKQYTLNKEAYTYWKSVREQLESDDFLYASQPYPVRSNLYNPDAPRETVLGYFTVASVKEKRIFVNNPAIRLEIETCFVNTDLRFIDPMSYRTKLYFTRGEDGLGMVDESCVDCRLAGGKTKKPEFWIDR